MLFTLRKIWVICILLCSDYDRTLKQNQSISPKTKNMLKVFKKQGHLFCVNTGRSYLSLMEDLSKFEIEADYFITSSGAEIHDSMGSLCFQKTINTSIIQDVLEFIVKQEIHTINLGYTEKKCTFNAKYAETWSKEMFPKDLENIVTINLKAETDDKAQIIQKLLITKFNVSAHVNRNSIDICSKGISKVSGILELNKILNFDKNEIVVVGDSLNDLEMIERFNGYTVDGAMAEVLDVAQMKFEDVGALLEMILQK